MSYKLKFLPVALKEWKKLNCNVQVQFKKQLAKRLKYPHIDSDRLKGDLKNYYKIKLRSLGYRLVYHVDDKEITVIVISVGKRDKSTVYLKAKERI